MTYKYRGVKLRRWNELSNNDQIDLLSDLLNAFALLKNPDEAALFITDLLTGDEVKFLSKRLRIAKLLLADWSYVDIDRRLKVSPVTIAKVSAWLKEKGEGFRRIISKIPERKKYKPGYDSPKFFWPGRLFEDLDKAAVKPRDEELKRTFNTLQSKNTLRRKIDEEFKERFIKGKR